MHRHLKSRLSVGWKRPTTLIEADAKFLSSPVGGGALALLAHHLEGVLIISGPKLLKTGGRSTDDPTGDSTGQLTS